MTTMFNPRKNSLPTPSLEDSFYPLSPSSSISLSFALPPSATSQGSMDSAGGIETDLILAAELGQALLEKNEELAASLKQREKVVEVLQQEKHVLQRKLNVSELTSVQKEAELNGDLASLRAELERQQSNGRERRRDESEQLTQLSNHNQRLVEQLAEAVMLEHTLRTELRTLREEMEESSFSRNISSTQLGSMQAENKVLQERLSHMAALLKTSQEDAVRLHVDREALRERVSELQSKLREKQAEAKEALLAHSSVLHARDDEIESLKDELKSRQEELECLKEESVLFRSSPDKLSYSALEAELATVRKEKESLTQELLNTIKQKVVMSQELEAWQEDMRLVISQQVQQREEERQKDQQRARESPVGLQRSRSLRVRGEGGKGFFSSLFGDK